MKNRPSDVPYNGVRKDVIDAAQPVLNPTILQHHWQWMRDRYEVHINKDVLGTPAPWTKNPILQQVKFCNLFREDDRQSRWLIENIASQTQHTLMDRCFNIILFRLWNKAESYIKATKGKLLKFPLSQADAVEIAANIAEECVLNPDYAWYSGAYNTAPIRNWMLNMHCGKDSSKTHYPSAPLVFCQTSLTQQFWNIMHISRDQKSVVEALKVFPYVGGNFLTYQLFVDFTYCPDYQFSENEYTVSGPGCIDGINLLFEDRAGMTHDECIFWLRDNFQRIYGPLGYKPEMFCLEPHKQINVMCLENTFCELQKYVRCDAMIAEGKKPRGKSNYDGTGGAKAVDLFNIK